MLYRLNLILRQTLVHFESLVFGKPFPPGQFGLAGLNSPALPWSSAENPKSIVDSIKDNILWAVPKSRRTVEKKLKRKFGWPEYHWKPLVPKVNLLNCNSCGHSYEAGHLCPNCYQKVKVETEVMQKAIEESLKLNPVEKEVVVLYEGETVDSDKFWQGKHIVEMKKPRPSWFSKNLLQKTTTETSPATDVKPTDLA